VNSHAPKRVPRILASLAVVVASVTFLAAQVDFVRRNHIGIAPDKYWLPQLWQIWIPGLGSALMFGLLSFLLHRRGRRA
jgi:hypothetical protein